MKLIWSDDLSDEWKDYQRKRLVSDPEGMAIAIVAMAFFLTCLVMAGIVAWLAQ